VLVPMTKVRILGRRSDVQRVIGELHRLGLVEIADARASDAMPGLGDEQARSAYAEDLRRIADRIESLLAQITPAPGAPAAAHEDPLLRRPPDADSLTAELGRLSPPVDALRRRLDALRDERLVLPGYIEPLRRLLPLVPELADLDDERLRLLRLGTVALVLNTDDGRIVDALRAGLSAELGPRFDLVWTRVEGGAIGCLIVFPQEHQQAIRALLGRAQVRQAALPQAFERLSLHAAVDAMSRRLAELPRAVADAEAERDALLLPHAARLSVLRGAVAAELERLEAAGQLGATGRAFVAFCWVPRRELSRLRHEIAARLGSAVVVEDLATSPRDPEAPLLMRNRRPARAFEPLARFLELPRAGSLDPTLLIALFFPLMFGAMVGDAGYGAVLLAIGLLLRRSPGARAPALRGVGWILMACAAWSIVFGVLYGELFGDLGQRVFGDWAVWRYRPAADALEPLLILSVAVGAAHVVLGLVLGAWQSIRFGERRELFDKLGVLLVLAGLFGLAGWAADRLPAGALTPSAAAAIVGLVLVMSLHGALGLITGPLALLGFVGNVLSYLRLAAVGLASAHLAGVANELGTVGPIWMGVIVAAFFHAINLALAMFSPTIQALRLHYVEFFGTFFVGGGRPFRPFGRAPEREIQPAT
jgi:V/A-type H+/Na+-transporting ATPase subunit I